MFFFAVSAVTVRAFGKACISFIRAIPADAVKISAFTCFSFAIVHNSPEKIKTTLVYSIN